MSTPVAGTTTWLATATVEVMSQSARPGSGLTSFDGCGGREFAVMPSSRRAEDRVLDHGTAPRISNST